MSNLHKTCDNCAFRLIESELRACKNCGDKKEAHTFVFENCEKCELPRKAISLVCRSTSCPKGGNIKIILDKTFKNKNGEFMTILNNRGNK